MLDHLKNAPVRVSDMPPDALRRYCARRHEQFRDEWLRGRERPSVAQRIAAFLFSNPHRPDRRWSAWTGSRRHGYWLGIVVGATYKAAWEAAKARWPGIRIGFLEEED